MPEHPQMLARGPWSPEQVEVSWLDEAFTPPADLDRLADEAVRALRERGSPAHDGESARLASWREEGGTLLLELQRARWSLRLIEGRAEHSMTALCVVRREDGAWLAGRRAAWLSTWAGRWALGAGGAVDVGESPAHTLARELGEEWQLEPIALRAEALISLPTGLAMLVGQATVASDAPVVPDHEHDEYAWWPAEVDRWPDEADDRLRAMGRLLAQAAQR